MENNGDNHRSNIRRRWRRWAVLLVLAGGLLWLNGPGLRWLGPKLARHFLAKAGMRASFVLEGSLSSGVSVSKFHLESDGAVARLTADSLKPDYRIIRLLNGRIDGIKADGLHLELRLDAARETPPEEKKPLDLNALTGALRSMREKFIPVEVDLGNLSLSAKKNGESVFALAPSSIRHRAGEPLIDVRLGAITDATGRRWPEHNSSITWNEDALAIDRIDPLPDVGISDLTVRLPVEGELSMECKVRVGNAGFTIDAAPGLSSIQINLVEGALTAETAERFGLKLQFSGEVTSFSASVENLLPDPGSATASMRILVERVFHDGWEMSELSMDAALEASRVTVAARAFARGAELSLDAESGVARGNGSFQLENAHGTFRVPEVPALVTMLAARIKALDPDATVPEASLKADFHIGFSNNRTQTAVVDLLLNPVDTTVATPVAIKARWHPDAPVAAELAVDGATARGDYDIAKTSYQGHVELKTFKTSRIDPWLHLAKVGTEGAVMLTGEWKGGGSIRENQHDGELHVDQLDLSRDGAAPVQLLGGIEYKWPGRLVTHGLKVTAGTQQISGDLRMEDGRFHLSDLVWKDGETEMASGAAELPVPQEPEKWREMLARDERPLSVSLATKELRISGLADWIPDVTKLDPRARGSAMLKISGTFAKPVIDAGLQMNDLRMNDRKDLPPADLELRLAARESRLSLEGNMAVPKLPPAVISASMSFRPAEWAVDPELMAAEKISARADLTRVELSRFAAMIPMVTKLSGALTANFEAAGEIRRPELKGRLDLTNAAVEWKRADIPPLAGVGASADFSREKITLRELKATMAGGTLSAGGFLTLENGKPAAIDLRVKGDHVPVKRDESLIIRANADLRLSGSWERAALTGSIGAVDGIFYRDIELLPIGSPFTGTSAASLPKFDTPAKPADLLPEPFRSWLLNVVVLTENPFLIRGNLATGKIAGKVRVGGTLGTPRPDGEVKISDLRASLPFSTLEVRKGILRFTPDNGFDPALEIHGSAEPRPYRVSMYVYGRASDPQLLLTSSPPLPENEIMTLLATGTTTSCLEDPQMASSRALQLFAEEIRRGRFVIGKQLRPLLGLLDRVDFSVAEADPYSSESYSTATLRLTDRWYLSAGMGGEGDSRVLGIWRLRFY